FAATTLAVVLAVMPGERRLGDAILLCLLGLLSIRSYESMLYLGPLVAAAILWSLRQPGDAAARGLTAIAALAFLAGAVVAGATIADYWNHPHFVKVRSTSLEFWQNLQLVIPMVGVALAAAIALVWPRWLRGRGPSIVIGIAVAGLVLSPWYRLL